MRLRLRRGNGVDSCYNLLQPLSLTETSLRLNSHELHVHTALMVCVWVGGFRLQPTSSLYGVGEDSVGRVVLGVVDEAVLDEGQVNSCRAHGHASRLKRARK